MLIKKLVAATLAVTLLAGMAFLAKPESNVLAFTLTGVKWSGGSATYLVNANFTDPNSGSAAQQTQAIKDAADEWRVSGQGGFEFDFGGATTNTATGADSVNNVYYAGGDGGGALAVCYYWSLGGDLTDFDIEFYDVDGATDFLWSLNPNGGEFDIQGVATHEFGHALGLDHSAQSSAVMFATINSGSISERTLTADDIAGYQSMYGTANPATPELTAVTPATGWIDGGTTVTIDGRYFPASGMTVNFGGSLATNVQRVSSSQITCVTPAGANPGSVGVTATVGSSVSASQNLFSYDSMRVSNAVARGQWTGLEARIPSAGNIWFQGAISLGNTGINLSAYGDISDTRVLPLAVDFLLEYTLYDGAHITQNIQGMTDIDGRKWWQFFVPNDPSLQGLDLHLCYLTGDTGNSLSGVSFIGNLVSVTVP